jgi:acyl carrier protein
MNNNSAIIKDKVKQYINQAVHVDAQKIKDTSLIFKEGFLDSMGFIVLITFLEEEFKIKTVDSDLIEENFESINAITDFVVKKSAP